MSRFEKSNDLHLKNVDAQLADIASIKAITKTQNKMLNNQVTKIGCIGDSITYGYKSGGGQETIQYPEKLQSYLQNVYNNTNITVENQGQSGYQTATWLSGSPSLYDTTLNNNYDLVIIMLGINDVQGRLGVYVNIDDFKTNLNTMVQKALAKGSEVILLSPTMTMAKTEFTTVANSNSVIRQYADVCKYVAERNNVFFVDIQQEFHDLFYTKNIFKPFDIINSVDYVHLLSYGYDVLAQLVLKNMCKQVLVVNSTQQDIPAIGSPYLDTTFKSSDVNSTSAQGSIYNMEYYKASGNSGYLRLKCFIDFNNIDMQVVHARNAQGGQLTVYDQTTSIGTIDYSTTDNALPTNTSLYSSSSRFTLGYGYHEIIMDMANLVQGSAVSTPFYMYLEGFRFIKNSQKHNPNSKFSFTHGGAAVQQALSDFLLTVQSNKKLILEFEGLFDPNTGIGFLGHATSLSSPSPTYIYNAILKHDSATNKVILYSYSQSNQSSFTTTNGVSTLDFSKRHKYAIEIKSDKTVKVYVDGVLEISVSLTTNLLAGRFSAWAYDTTIDRSCEIYNLQSYIV